MPISKDGDKQKMNCVVTKEQYTEIQKAAEKIGCTASTIVRMAINEWLKNHANDQLYIAFKSKWVAFRHPLLLPFTFL